LFCFEAVLGLIGTPLTAAPASYLFRLLLATTSEG